jgi:hypothetical protein
VIHRWEGTRHFYVVVAGAVEVRGVEGQPELLRRAPLLETTLRAAARDRAQEI